MVFFRYEKVSGDGPKKLKKMYEWKKPPEPGDQLAITSHWLYFILGKSFGSGKKGWEGVCVHRSRGVLDVYSNTILVYLVSRAMNIGTAEETKTHTHTYVS
jgi:hypothetical protein